jgi:2-methylcitrate dehydratase PrpD
MLALRKEYGLRAEQEARIESWTHKRRLAHTNRPDPRSALDAKFSVQYCLARALLHGAVSIDHFAGDAWQDAAVQALLPRVQAAVYTEAQFPPENHYGAEVRVTLHDGRAVTARVDQAHGRTSDNPLSPEMMKVKFLDCAARVLPPHRSEQLYHVIQQFEQLADVRDLTRSIEIAPAAEAKRAVA